MADRTVIERFECGCETYSDGFRLMCPTAAEGARQAFVLLAEVSAALEMAAEGADEPSAVTLNTLN